MFIGEFLTLIIKFFSLFLTFKLALLNQKLLENDGEHYDWSGAYLYGIWWSISNMITLGSAISPQNPHEVLT